MTSCLPSSLRTAMYARVDDGLTTRRMMSMPLASVPSRPLQSYFRQSFSFNDLTGPALNPPSISRKSRLTTIHRRHAAMSDFRIEKDSMGDVKVPAQAYYGAQTQRAVENFPISGQPL